MDDDAPELGAPRLDGHLVLLRWLVTVLTATMIVGFIVLIVLFVTRLPKAGAIDLPDSITLPDSIALPGGATATAFTRGSDWYAVVTDDDRILIYDATTQALRQTIVVE